MGTITVEIPARLEAIDKVQQAIAQAAQEAGFGERTIYACQLAVSEACENIINHGYPPGSDGTITLLIDPQPGDLAMELRDRARPFNPAAAEGRSAESKEDPPVGGLGLVILHRVMDEVRYQRDGDENSLHLRKLAEVAAD